MKAKTTKFLAVLAVLAVAFAGVAVLVQGQSSDAAAGEAVTKDTYDDAFEAKVFTSIKLEDIADVKSVVLYQNKVGTTPATTIEAGMAYFFAADATGTNKVSLPTNLTLDKPVMFFILDGVTVEVAPGKLADGAYAMIQAVCVKEYDAEAGIIVPADQKYFDEEADPVVNTLFDADGYAYNAYALSIPDLVYKAADRIWTYNNDGTGADAKACEGFKIIADMTYDRNFILASLNGEADLYSNSVISKDITTANFKKGKITVTMVDYTGTLVYEGNSITVKDFTGAIKSVPDIRTPKGTFAGFEVVSCEAGTVNGTAAGGLFVLDDGVSLTFAETATLGGAFGYIDEYNDMHFAVGSTPMVIGMGGLTICAGNNMIGFDGTLLLEQDEDLQFAGNVTLSGMVYSNGHKLSLENITADPKTAGEKMPADIKLGTFQVTDSTSRPGKVTLKTSVLVQAGCSFYVSGDLDIADGAVLKIAEGAVVKPEGTLTLGDGSAIWNAGQFIAKNYYDEDEGVYFDKQLIRVFMNTGYQTGMFYLGSTVYDGTVPADDNEGQTPLTVAFGAYLDMTGIDKVNLTSGGINVNSGLYKYNTLILATFDNTIALTASFDNQYPVTVSLDGKASATPVFTAKSATFRNVVWQSPISATLYVTAPEVYTVVLAQDVVKNAEGIYEVKKDAEQKPMVWTSGLTITDQNGRVIPISTADATKGQIQVVFGYEYTIEGATSTSNYKFISPNGELSDLTKVSKTEGKFTMIRNNLVNPEVPVVLQVTEGFATTLTVTLADDDKKYAVGDVFMHYAVADEKGKAIGDGTPVVLQLDDDNNKVGVIKDIYSNDTILFKSEFVKFYKSIALHENAKKIVFPTETNDNDTPDDTEEPVDVPFSSTKWSVPFTFEQPDTNKTSVSASFTLKCELNTVEVTFVFGQYDEDATPKYVDEDQRIIVNFTDYCSKSKHTETVTKKLSDTLEGTDATPGEFTIVMTVGEVYEVTWDEIDTYLSEMTYVDPNSQTPEKENPYTKNTAVTVTGERTYTLYEDKLIYITVENQTEQDLTLTIGQFSADIAKKKSNDKVIVNDDDNTLVLSKKGWTVEGWDFTVTYKTTPTDTSVQTKYYVSGPQTTETFAAINGKGGNDNSVVKITITNASIEKTRYFVNVLKDDHGAIDPFDQTGYIGDERKAYVTTQFGYTVTDVLYEYQEVDMTEKAVGHAVRGQTPEGVEVWTYTMPASNVLLKPVILKDTRTLSFVDQNGETIADTITVTPLTPVDMAVPCKPLYKIVEVTTEPQIDDFDYNPETGHMTFTMPDADVTVIVTCEEIDYSKDVIVTIGQKANAKAITLVITALDGKQIASGSITMYVNYTYVEDGEVWTDAVKVTVDYVADGSAYAVKNVDSFVTDLGDNYSGAFAVTGSFEFGYAEGNMSKTVYTPVLGA